MQNKKVLSTAITALLLLSILAAAAPAFAFDATSTITVTTVSGTAGTVGSTILVTGPTAGAGANPFGAVGLYWDTLGNLLNGTAFADNTGAFSIRAKIPSATAGQHFLIVQDSLGTTTSQAFTVVPSLSRGQTSRVLPGDTIALTGHGFAATSAITFSLTAPNGTTTITLTAPVVSSNATGSFSASIIVPATINVAVPSDVGIWTIRATDAVTPTGNTATATVTIDYYITVTPTSGPPGITLTIAGRIPANTAVTVTFGTAVAFSTTSDATGRFTGTYSLQNVPLLLNTAYTVTATWGPVGLTVTRTATFTTNAAAPTITLLPLNGQAGTTVSITATSFSTAANVTLTFGTTVVNSTATDSRFGPTSATTGGFTADFAVPALAPGAYTVTLTDQFGATATTVFTIDAAPVTTIAIGKATYLQGETLSFNIYTTETSLGTITVTIRDPTSKAWWIGTSNVAGAWTLSTAPDGSKYVAYQAQTFDSFNQIHAQLPSDAPTGSWNWTITYTPTSTGVLTNKNATFIVNAVGTSGGVTNADLNATLAAINTKLDGLSANIVKINATTATIQTSVGTLTTSLAALDAKVTSIQGTVATLQTSMGTVTASVSSLSGSISSISSGMATVQTSLGTITTSLSSLDAVLGAVAGDTTTLKTSLGTVTTSLDSIGTKVTSLQGDSATIKTDLGTLQGTVTSVSGNVATIQTALGTMQADISSLKTDVANTQTSTNNLSPLIIVAIVLALIAAIAAIASIVLMRRKIAG